jgi:uncharacterized protein (DUF111 family)
MTVRRVGCGAGTKDFEGQANILRLFVGETADPSGATGLESDQVCMLETNLDDLTGEMVGYCVGRLWEAGALDVYTTPIQMKKQRPGVMLTVLCRPEDANASEAILFRETTTLGVRRSTVNRRLLRREECTVQTEWGPVAGKRAWLPDGTPRFAPEFEACRRIAAERGLPLRAVYERVQAAVGSE